MWDNISEKIKILAKVIAWLGIISSVIGGIILISQGVKINHNSWNGSGGGLFILSGIGTLIVGPILSWIGSFFMYGFGELIENSEAIRYNTSKNKNTSGGNSVVDKFLNSNPMQNSPIDKDNNM